MRGTGAESLQVIYHEFAHALLRHNERFWPMWLKEGMADIYSTFEVTGDHSAPTQNRAGSISIARAPEIISRSSTPLASPRRPTASMAASST